MMPLSSIWWIRRVPWFILAVGLALVTAHTVQMKTRMERDDQLAFNIYCNKIELAISERLHDHARILRSAAAFLSVDETVTRDKWHRYIELQNTKNRLPGIQGIGFSLLIQPAERARHIQEIRNEGFPEYTIHPEGDRELYSAIIYLEPFDERNQRAFGYDMLSESVRRASSGRSRDEDLAVLSGKVLLVQETDEDVQAGMLMYVPVYRNGMPTDSVEQRRAALYGWVYSAYRMTDLMRGILGDQIQDQDPSHSRQIQVFDGESTLSQNLLFQSHSITNGPRHLKEQFNELIPIDFNGHRWTLRCIQTSGGLLSAPYRKIWVVCIGETLVAFIIFGLLWTLLSTSEKQYRVAQELTLKLRDERERMARIIQGTDFGTWEWNVQTGEIVVNDKWAQLIGYTLQELAPFTIKTREAFTHPDDFKRASDQLEKHFSGAISIYNCECRMRHKDGHWVWIQDRGRILTRTDDGQPLMMFGTHMEITERKQAEEQVSRLLKESDQAKRALLGIIEDNAISQVALQESEERARLMADLVMNSNQPVGVGFLDGRLGRLNPAFCDLLGYTEEELQAIDWSTALTPPEWLPAERKALAELERTGEPVRYEKEYIHKNGTRIPIELFVHLARDADGNPDYYYAFITDITERKRSEDQVLQLLADANKSRRTLLSVLEDQKRVEQEREMYVVQLEAQRVELERFTYTVSHDLKSPLITIKGFLGMLVKDAEAGNIERLRSDINRIKTAATKMGHLLADLLNLSRIGRIANELVDISMDALAYEVVETLNGPITERGVRLDIESGLPTVRGDPIRLHEVLQNLLENAIKFMGDQPSPCITIGSRVDQGEPVFTVRDNGQGIDPAYADKIFGLFEKLDGNTQGTGIGLALVKRIIEFHGGRVWVESEGPGCGCTFCFSIPLIGES